VESKEPAIRLKTYLRLLDHDYETKEVKKIIADLKKTSPVVSNLFSFLPKDKKKPPYHVYTKWQGTHWILADLADIGYPPGDSTLFPSRELELDWLLSKERWATKPELEGRKRFCASMEGNGLFSLLMLGLDDERCKLLANRLIKYQWEDGGWNCDKKPKAINSSYNESLIPMRALNLYATKFKDMDAKRAVKHATEVFLKRKLFKNLSNGEIIAQRWTKLRYPYYWMYSVLNALKVLSEIGTPIKDSRTLEALDLLESKRLSTGGFPANGKHFQTKDISKGRFSPVEWGGTGRRMNPWVSIDVLYVLKKAGRIDINH
jgi:hypothetical protein